LSTDDESEKISAVDFKEWIRKNPTKFQEMFKIIGSVPFRSIFGKQFDIMIENQVKSTPEKQEKPTPEKQGKPIPEKKDNPISDKTDGKIPVLWNELRKVWNEYISSMELSAEERNRQEVIIQSIQKDLGIDDEIEFKRWRVNNATKNVF